MKDSLNKIRRWLIKKLGGYTEQVRQEVPVHYHNAYQLYPAHLQKEARVLNYSGRDVSPREQDQMSRKLVDEMTAELIRGGFIRVRYANDPISCELICRAELYVIHPTDAAKCGL